MKRKTALLIALLVAVLLAGCGREQVEIQTLGDMESMTLTIGAPDHIDANDRILAVCPQAKIVPQNDELFGIRSVAEGRFDAYVVARECIEKATGEGGVKNVRILDEPLISYPCALGLSQLCAVPDYEAAVNATLERLIADGTMEDMRQRWFIQENEQMPEIELPDDPEYTLNAVTYGQRKPYSYLKDGELAGFDVELLYRVCAENRWGVKLTGAEYPSMLMGLSTGKYDVISANLYVTDSKSENTVFSVPYRTEEISVAVRGASDAASGADGAQELEYSTLEQLREAKVFAIQTGTICDTITQEHYPEARIDYFQTAVDGALALANGRVDALVYDAPTLAYIASTTQGVGLMPEYLAKEDYYFILDKSERGEKLRAEFNEWLSQQRQSGELDRLYAFWCGNEDPAGVMDFAALPAVNGTIRIETSTAGRPDVYFYNNMPVGYPIELIYNFCRDRGYGGELSVVNFDSVLPSLVTGKADIAVSLLSYTEERARSVLFTDAICTGGMGVLVRTAEGGDSASLAERFRSGFEKTFVAENRWKLIASGLGVTLLITLGGFLLANVLGAVFCACTMSGRKGLMLLSDVFDRIMQGTPMVVVLMILYYVVFGRTDISGAWVAVIAFGLNSGVSLARQFYGAITGVDRGQTEAALAIGFSRFQAFTGIVLPQAARTALPGYFSELIALMKGTAIVGYVAVIDLTKSGDLIRSSTFDAFFPLLAVALVYFLISFGILSLLRALQKKLAPRRVGRQEAQK